MELDTAGLPEPAAELDAAGVPVPLESPESRSTTRSATSRSAARLPSAPIGGHLPPAAALVPAASARAASAGPGTPSEGPIGLTASARATQPAPAASPAAAATPVAAGRATGAGRALARIGTLPAVGVAGWLAGTYPLLYLGVAHPLPALLVGLPVAVGLMWVVGRRLRPVPAAPWWVVGVTVALAAGFGLLSAANHAEHVVIRRDPAVYALAAHWVAGHGTVVVPSGLAALGGTGHGLGAASPGFYAVGDSLVPQFMSGTSLALAPGGWVSDWGGILTLPAIYAALALLAVGALVARVAGPRWAPIAVLALGLSQPELLTARTTLSEPLAQLLLVGGCYLLVETTGPGSARPGRAPAALAGLLIGLSTLIRVDALREVVLLLPVIGWLLARRSPHWPPLAVGLLVGTGYGVADALGPSRPYVHDLLPTIRPLLAAGVAVGVVSGLGAVALRRPGPALIWAAGRPRWLPAAASLGSVAVAAGIAYLVARPWLTVAHGVAAPTAQVLAGMQSDLGLEVDGTRTYAEQSVRWLSWYLGWPTLVLAAAAAVVLAWRVLRGRSPRWAPVLPVLLGSTVLVLWRPNITPDHPWADRRLVPTVLPAVVLLAITTLGWLVHRLRASRRVISRGTVVAVALVGIGLVTVPAAAGSAPLSRGRTEQGEPAAVAAACGSFQGGDVALLVDARTRQEWLPGLRQLCQLPTFAVLADNDDDTATVAEVGAAVHRVRAAGSRPVLVAASGQPLPGLTPRPQRQIVHLSTYEQDRTLVQPPTRLQPLDIQLWIALPG